MTDDDRDAAGARSPSFLSRVFVAVSPLSRANRPHRDELASISSQHHSFGATSSASSDDDSDVEAFVDARSEADYDSVIDRASEGRSNGRWASAPGRRLRALGASALIAVAVTAAAALAPRDGTTRSSLASEDVSAPTWGRSDAAVRTAPAGGRRLPPGYKRSTKWSPSKFSSAAGAKSWLSIASFGSLAWPASRGRLGTWRDADALSWNPTKLRDTNGVALPESFDVREKWPKCAKLVSEAVDQGECGSCWAVAPSKVMADRLCIATNGNVRTHLSAMQLLACQSFAGDAYKEDSGAFVSAGCDGGFPTDAYENAYENGIVSGGLYGDEQTCMPYQYPPCQHPCAPSHAAQCPHTCHGNKTAVKAARHLVKEIVTCGFNDYDCMAREIFERGPVSTYVGDVYDEFYQYTSGIYTASDDVSARGANHGGHVMEVIGWGVNEDGLRYWKVYNSWLNWGHKGYGHIAVGELSIGENIEAALMSP